ncbi:MAG: GNAT family N-acetyltransferase [Meiothermus sp.]
MPELIRPSVAYKDSYLAALQEFQAEDRLLDLDPAWLRANFPVFVRKLLDRENPDKVPPGFSPETVLWLVEGEEFLGRVSIRHQLVGTLSVWGGHIGYEIRPSARRKGYGTLGLRLALPWARQLGLGRVLVTCDKSNVGSRKIIEANAGVLESEVRVEGHAQPKLRFWIEL